MTNPFTSLFTPQLKQLHKDMIDATIDGCAVECTLHYQATKFEDCANCSYDVIGGKSSNRYLSGGPVPFYHGSCPLCNGQGKRQVNIDETIFLCPIWDSKDWYKLSLSQVNMAEINVQTMSKITTYNKLKRCTSISIDNKIEGYGIPEFIRVGDPEPCGFGDSTHIITSWKRK